MDSGANRYSQIMAAVFERYYREGDQEVAFERSDIEPISRELGIRIPKNLGDVIYSFRYRTLLPESIRVTAPEGYEWLIRPDGTARYKFVLMKAIVIAPSPLLAETKIPDATPGIIQKYSLNDEQSLLARLRYNRLIDIFTGLTCYSLQNHLRTTVASIGQVETDEIYIGLDSRGAHYVIPVQAKSASDRIGIIQIEQDFAVCEAKFSGLICRPIATQFISTDVIAIFAFEKTDEGIRISAEKHYRLVPPEQLSDDDIRNYRERLE